MGCTQSRVVPSSARDASREWEAWRWAAYACKQDAKQVKPSHVLVCVVCGCVDRSDFDFARFPLPLPDPPTSPPQSAAEVEHAICGITFVQSTVLRERVGELARRIDMASARHVALSLLDALGADRRPHEGCELGDILVAALMQAYALRSPAGVSASNVVPGLPCDLPASKEVPGLPCDLPASKEVPELPSPDPNRKTDLPPMKWKRTRLAPIGSPAPAPAPAPETETEADRDH